MENVLESNDGYTRARYEAALRGTEYALLKSGGVMEIAELYRPMNGTNGTNGRAHGANALTVPVRSIDMYIAGETLPA